MAELDLRIRPADRGDHPAVEALFAEVDRLHREALPDVFQEVEGPTRTLTWLDDVLTDVAATLLLACDGADALGLIEVREASARALPMFRPRRYAMIDTLVVRADARGRGVGRHLLDAAHAWAAQRGLKEIELHVWEPMSDARAFYTSLGYETRSRRLRRRLG